MGKTRYTQNQDYFKLSGSGPGADQAEAARRAFGMQRARERLSSLLKFGASPGHGARSARSREAVQPTEVLPPEAHPEAPVGTTAVVAEMAQAAPVPPFHLLEMAWDVAHWPLLLLEQGWRRVRHAWHDLVQKGEQRSGRYLGLG